MVAGYIARFGAQEMAHTILPVGTYNDLLYSRHIFFYEDPFELLQDLHRT